MSFDVDGHAHLKSAQPGPTPAGPARALLTTVARPPRSARIWLWIAMAGIGASLITIVVVSLARKSWMGPPLQMPRIGPPFQLASLQLSLNSVAVALWLSAIAGGLGVAAGLIAVRQGARPPLRLLLITAATAVAVLTLLPPVGSTDALDYMAFGRILVLGHSPYVMVPWDLIHIHDAVRQSIPWEWGRNTTPYGPAATVEEFMAAKLGGMSAARIVFWLKLANAAAFGLVSYTADRLLRSDPALRLRAHLLWTVNPLLIWQLIAAAHLDVLAAAAGMLGLIVAAGWPTAPVAGHPPIERVVAGGALIGLAADIKITFVLFGLGLAWALRRTPASCAAAGCGMLAVLLPSYAWFGPPAIWSVQNRDDRTTADNFYQLFSHAKDGFLMQHIGLVATVLVIGLAIVTLSRLPGRSTTHPAIYAALALSTAWLFLWQYQLPSYEAMVICLLVLVPAGWLDWLVVARLTAATIALMPGNPTPLRSHLLAKIAYENITLTVPIVLLAVVAVLIVGCLLHRRRKRQILAPAALRRPDAMPLSCWRLGWA